MAGGSLSLLRAFVRYLTPLSSHPLAQTLALFHLPTTGHQGIQEVVLDGLMVAGNSAPTKES